MDLIHCSISKAKININQGVANVQAIAKLWYSGWFFDSECTVDLATTKLIKMTTAMATARVNKKDKTKKKTKNIRIIPTHLPRQDRCGFFFKCSLLEASLRSAASLKPNCSMRLSNPLRSAALSVMPSTSLLIVSERGVTLVVAFLNSDRFWVMPVVS